ncbi:conjugative transposon protein TraM [Elizabethkingia anophelis]|uniref:conjugative transposon protein TraM n=1 Tax=Elizabethkingia anophelis TaxID=1117645 RepID=UPI00136D9EFB|nr:conjugative transposon protein TraM [Elizabethkingia anophelis]MYY43965.1 conjugative transposon protein TraM [Elizabethkingia anophelis]
MEDKEKKSIFIREKKAETSYREEAPSQHQQRLKKILIYLLMAIACVGALYLIFKPGEQADTKETGLNNAVPEANNISLQGDKEKAYEQEMLAQKDKERRSAMQVLSDYFNSPKDSTEAMAPVPTIPPAAAGATTESQKNYQDIQKNLGSFYETDREKESLRREVRELREKMNSRPSPGEIPPDPVAVMEKSYQMAAKYLPQMMPPKPSVDSSKASAPPKRYVEPIYNVEKNIVSSLKPNQSDAEFAVSVLQEKPQRLFGDEASANRKQQTIYRNSIRACIHQTQTITAGSSVQLRLLENARVAKMLIPPGTLLTAMAKIESGRLALQITSIEFEGNIVPVDILAYDLDGQSGLNLPYSPDLNAVKEVTAGMSNSAGTSISMNSSPGKQLLADLTKGVVQGTTGYISKRIGTLKVTVKAGHQLFLVPKK